MTFNYSVQLNDPTDLGGAADTFLVDDLEQALSVWSQYISGAGTLVVALDIENTSVGRAAGGPTSDFLIGHKNGLDIYEPSSEYELTTGQHVSGTTSDITISIDPGYFRYLDLASSLTYSSQVPSNEYNPVDIFLHEILHGLGMSGWYSQSGVLPGAYESNFDQNIEITSSGAVFFTGPAAEAVFGGPVPLTYKSTSGENYYHFGNQLSDNSASPSTVKDPLTLDLMNGIVFFFDHQYPVSDLDLAVLKDLGYTVSGSGTPYSAPGGFPFTSHLDITEALYVGYFGRAGDPSGTSYWTNALSNGLSPQAMAASFSVQPESEAHYAFLADPTAASSTQVSAFVSSVYQDLFNRAPDPGGSAYWQNYLSSQQGDPQAVGTFILAVIDGAQNTTLGQDQTAMANKVAAAEFLTQEFTNAGISFNANATAANQFAHSDIAAVTSDISTVAAAETAVAAFIDANSSPTSSIPLVGSLPTHPHAHLG
jgi:hypothetical protein